MMMDETKRIESPRLIEACSPGGPLSAPGRLERRPLASDRTGRHRSFSERDTGLEPATFSLGIRFGHL